MYENSAERHEISGPCLKAHHARSGFPSAKDKVTEIYVNFNRATENYTMSKPLLGPNSDEDEVILGDMMKLSEWTQMKSTFPDMIESGYFSFCCRRDNARHLWELAGRDTKTTGNLIDQLSTPAS